MPGPDDRSWVVDLENGVDLDGTIWGVGGSVNQLAPSETFFGRGFYFTMALGSGQAAFNPTGRNEAGTLVEEPVDWTGEVLDVINDTSAGTYDGGHSIVVVPNVLGIRTADATWPGHAAITAWTPGDSSYVDDCVTAWADLMLTVPIPTPVRLWHEQGNGVYGNPANWNVFIANWRKVHDRWVALGALAADKCRLVWCPASHPLSPDDDAESWPGEAYVGWVGRDIYLNDPAPTWDDAAQLWYESFNPIDGPYNTTNMPMMACESGVPTSDSGRTAKFAELATKLQTDWVGLKTWLWWNDAEHTWDNNVPSGWSAQVTSDLSDPYTLPDGYQGAEAGGDTATPSTIAVSASIPTPTIVAGGGGALTIVQVTCDGDTSNNVAGGYNTASIPVVAGRLYLVAFASSDNVDPSEPSSVNQGANTFTKIGTFAYADTTLPNRRLNVWACIASSTVSAAVNINITDSTGCVWQVIEVQGFNSTSLAVAVPTAKFATAFSDTAATSLTLTMGSLGNASNGVIAWFGHSADETKTAGANYTGLGSCGYGTPNVGIASEYASGPTDLTPDMSWTNATAAGAVGVEVVAAAVSGNITATPPTIAATGSVLGSTVIATGGAGPTRKLQVVKSPKRW